MKKLFLFILFLGTLSLTSCDSSKAKKCANDFFASIKAEDETKMDKLYPSMSELKSYKKSDGANVKDVTSLGDDKYKVTVTNSYTNSFGKTFETDIDLFIKKNARGDFFIYDSKGLCGYEDSSDTEDIYKFCLKTGCIKDRNLTDINTAKQIKEGYKLAAHLLVQIMSLLESEVKVVDWEWETSYYSNSASGKGIVHNGSSFDVDNLKYEITYKDRNGTPITTDDGTVSYSTIPSGQSQSFSFYTSYVGAKASKASIHLVFDKDGIIKEIINSDWDSDTYEKYKSEL